MTTLSAFPAYNTLPASHDLKFLAQKTGIQILGSAAQNDGTVVITYDNPPSSGHFAAMSQAIADYSTSYLPVALPRRIAEVKSLRDQHISGFMFNGINIELDVETKANIVGCMMGLERNPEVPGIDWSLGDGTFIFLPRVYVGMLADAMFMHVQTCFSMAKAKIALLKATTNLEGLAAIDINSGWPS